MQKLIGLDRIVRAGMIANRHFASSQAGLMPDFVLVPCNGEIKAYIGVHMNRYVKKAEVTLLKIVTVHFMTIIAMSDLIVEIGVLTSHIVFFLGDQTQGFVLALRTMKMANIGQMIKLFAIEALVLILRCGALNLDNRSKLKK